MHLMQSKKIGDHMASLSIEDSSKFDNAFVDTTQDKDKNKNKDIKFKKK